MKLGHPALTRDRLSHVAQNYLRTDTLAAANARLIDAQASIGVGRRRGGRRRQGPYSERRFEFVLSHDRELAIGVALALMSRVWPDR